MLTQDKPRAYAATVVAAGGQVAIEQEDLVALQAAVNEGVRQDGRTLLDEVREGRSHGCFIMSPHIERALARPERLSGVRSCRAGRR